jgi:hypothetical protein
MSFRTELPTNDTRYRYHESRSRSYFTTDSQLVSQSVSQSVCLGIEYPCGTCDPILFPVGMLLSEICGLVSGGGGCPLWREDGSAIYSVITQWSETPRTRNHNLLSQLRLPQPGGPSSRRSFLYIYVCKLRPSIERNVVLSACNWTDHFDSDSFNASMTNRSNRLWRAKN